MNGAFRPNHIRILLFFFVLVSGIRSITVPNMLARVAESTKKQAVVVGWRTHATAPRPLLPWHNERLQDTSSSVAVTSTRCKSPVPLRYLMRGTQVQARLRFRPILPPGRGRRGQRCAGLQVQVHGAGRGLAGRIIQARHGPWGRPG